MFTSVILFNSKTFIDYKLFKTVKFYMEFKEMLEYKAGILNVKCQI